MYKLHDKVVSPLVGTWKGPFDPSGLGVTRLFPANKIMIAVGVGALLLAAIANELLAARYLSSDGLLAPSTVFSIRLLQAVLVVSAIGLVTSNRVPFLVALLAVSAINLSSSRPRAVPDSSERDRRALQATLEELHKVLAGETHVGYISDEMPFAPSAPPTSVERYYLTQYALAPVVVELGRTSDLIVGNFRTFNPQLTTGLTVVRDFRDGLVLLRTEAK